MIMHLFDVLYILLQPFNKLILLWKDRNKIFLLLLILSLQEFNLFLIVLMLSFYCTFYLFYLAKDVLEKLLGIIIMLLGK